MIVGQRRAPGSHQGGASAALKANAVGGVLKSGKMAPVVLVEGELNTEALEAVPTTLTQSHTTQSLPVGLWHPPSCCPSAEAQG